MGGRGGGGTHNGYPLPKGWSKNNEHQHLGEVRTFSDKNWGQSASNQGRMKELFKGGGVVLNVNFKKVFFALISALTLYIGNV